MPNPASLDGDTLVAEGDAGSVDGLATTIPLSEDTLRFLGGLGFTEKVESSDGNVSVLTTKEFSRMVDKNSFVNALRSGGNLLPVTVTRSSGNSAPIDDYEQLRKNFSLAKLCLGVTYVSVFGIVWANASAMRHTKKQAAERIQELRDELASLKSQNNPDGKSGSFDADTMCKPEDDPQFVVITKSV